MKNIFLFALFAFYLIIPVWGAETKMPVATIKFNRISALKIDILQTNIEFSVSDSNEISIQGESEMLSKLEFNESNTELTVTRGRYSLPDSVSLHISVPAKCLLELTVAQNSDVFVPKMNAPVRINIKERGQVVVEGCVGLIVTANEKSTVSVNKCVGDISVTLNDKSVLNIKQAEIEKALIKAMELSKIHINGNIKSLNLVTQGAANIKLESVTEAFVWAGRGNDQVAIQKLSGIADVTSNYNSVLRVGFANLKTLLAATAANGKIQIGGTVENAALSTRGGSQIVIDKVTGKILRKNEMRKGSIKILNP